MHRSLKTLIASLMIAGALPALAAEEHQRQQAAPAHGAGMPMDAAGMDAHMKKMQEIHDRIAAAKTPEQRQAAMQEGMLAMRDGMAMLQRHCPGMGMGMGMGSGAGKAGQPHDGMGMSGMMDMMMKMMDQQSHMMQMPMHR